MRVFLSTLLICSMMLPSAGLAAPSDKGGKTPPPLVKVETVALKNANRPEKYVGHVEAIESIDLQARVEGYLGKVNFREGSSVEKGQLLYVIEQPPYKARVTSARARVTQAEANLFKAETRLRRLRSAQPESVPQTELDDGRAARDLARGQLEEARANLELAQIDLDYTTIEAPMDGRIGKSFYKKGDLVSPASRPLAEIVSVDPIRVVFSVSEKQIDMIQQAFIDAKAEKDEGVLKVQLEFANKREYAQTGRIAFIDNKMDPDTGTIAVWARFDNPKGRLVPGEYVNVFVRTAEPDMQPAIAQRALQTDRQGDFVYIVDEANTVKKRRIRTGPALEDRFIVKSGVSKGERVIVEGLQKVRPEMKVKTRGSEEKEDS
ncbi:MAG: efflux RND transporter periplasmic adaptor subunit [Desulfosalsimonadaceae bacterium]